MKRTIQIQTIYDPLGKITASGEVARDKEYDPITEGVCGRPFDVYNLKVINEDGYDITVDLDSLDIEIIEDALIEKYIDEEADAQNYMIDEAIERGKEYKHLAYA